MSEFNRRSYEAGKNGGSSPVSSTPGQPANMKDREAYWQGKAQAQWTKPPSSASSSQPSSFSPSSRGSSGGGGRGGGAAAGRGVAGLIVVAVLIWLFVSHGSSDKKADGSIAGQSEQSPLEGLQAGGNPSAKPSPINRQFADSAASNPAAAAPAAANPVAANPGSQIIPPAVAGNTQSAIASVPAPVTPAAPVAGANLLILNKTYSAKHKEGWGGGCSGTLVLSASGAQFDCPSEHYKFPLNSIAGVNSDGFILNSGEKYHFHIDGKSKNDVEAEISGWLSQAKRAKATQMSSGVVP